MNTDEIQGVESGPGRKSGFDDEAQLGGRDGSPSLAEPSAVASARRLYHKRIRAQRTETSSLSVSLCVHLWRGNFAKNIPCYPTL
jgi:hypothetical protein